LIILFFLEFPSTKLTVCGSTILTDSSLTTLVAFLEILTLLAFLATLFILIILFFGKLF